MIAERSIENLVSPNASQLQEAGIQTVYYDQEYLESLSDSTPLPDERRIGISGQETRTLVYTSGT